MKHLTKFIEYLKESNDVPDDDIKVMFLPFEDLGVKCELLGKQTITEGKYMGRVSRNIILTPNFKTDGGWMIDDDRYWEFLDELITFKNRLESDDVSVNMNWVDRIRIRYILGSSETGDILELKTLYNKIHGKLISSRSDFSNDMTIETDYENKRFIVHCSSGFTNRKWKLFITGMDISKFDMDIKILGEPRKGTFPYEYETFYPPADIIFTLKN